MVAPGGVGFSIGTEYVFTYFILLLFLLNHKVLALAFSLVFFSNPYVSLPYSLSFSLWE